MIMAEQRLIDAEAFEYYVNILYCSKCETIFENCHNTDCWIDKARRTLEALPTIEAKPVVHAHWNDDGRCTNCGGHAPFFAYADDWFETKYCPHCGAQMDGKEK